jgi:hypothetical protein
MTNEDVFTQINRILSNPTSLDEKFEVLDNLSWKIVNHHPQGRASEALKTVLWLQGYISHRINIGDLDEHTPLISSVVG